MSRLANLPSHGHGNGTPARSIGTFASGNGVAGRRDTPGAFRR